MSKMMIAAGLLLSAGAAANADLFTDEAAFLGAIEGDYYLEEFDGYTYGSYTELTLDLGPVNGYSYTLDANTGAGDPGLWSGDGNMSTNSALNLLTVTFTGDDVTAVGGFFFASEINGFYIPEQVTVELSDGQMHVFTPATDTEFIGFTSATPITSLTIDADDTFQNAWSTMDHFYVGAVIPAPGAAALFGLAGLVARRRG
jgi:hypothetical protein